MTMVKLSGLVYVKHGRVGSRSEGPDYYLQTYKQDFLLRYQPRLPFQPDYHLEFYSRRMVEVEGTLVDPHTLQVASIHETCASAIPPLPAGPHLGAPFQVKHGEKVRLEDAGIEVELMAVEQDSRCPTGVVCVWEGQAVVVVGVATIGGVGEKARLTLRAGHPDLASAEVLGYRVTITDLQPHPVGGQPPPAEGSYVATLTASALT